MRAEVSPKHLDFIRSLPCVICHDNTADGRRHTSTISAICRAAKPLNRHGHQKPRRLLGHAPAVRRTPSPSSTRWAREVLGGSRWRGCDPIFLAMALYCASGNYEAGEQIVSNAGQPILKATLRVADAVIQGHLISAFSSAEGTQQMLGVRKAIAAALNE